MRRCLASLGATIALVLAMGAGTAFAGGLPTLPTTTTADSSQTQSSSQTEKATNEVDQNATSNAVSAPGVQSNVNAPVSTGGTSCCDGGGSGDVTQSNSSTASSEAENTNNSTQGIDQQQGSNQSQSGESQGSGCCANNDPKAATTTNSPSQPSEGQSQTSRQSEKAKNDIDQNAGSSATSAPGVQSNVNAPVRVGSNGDNGDVNQSNSSTANSEAENKNTSDQSIDQNQGSGQQQSSEQEGSSCCNSSSSDPQSQRSSQREKAKNDVDQNAGSDATSAPGVQSNVNEPVTVASNDCYTACVGGDGGNVDQSNSSTANSEAENKNHSTQGIDQGQWSRQGQSSEQEGSPCCNSSGETDQSQRSRQKERAKNDVDQNAGSSATSAPGVQSNVNAPVRVLSNGSDGDVNQSNSSTASSEAENKNHSTQSIDQDQWSRQGQWAEQEASSCCNGSSGDLNQSQSNRQKEKAKNEIDQNATSSATSAPGVQSNVNAPVGDSYGDVDQSNSSTANSEAENTNHSSQWIGQDQGSNQVQSAEQEGSPCCNGSSADPTQNQWSSQKERAKNDVDQNATSSATSVPGVQSNTNAPVSAVEKCTSTEPKDPKQSNSSTASSEAENTNVSSQSIDQDQWSGQQQDAEQEASACCNGSSGDLSQNQSNRQKEKAKNDVDQNADSTATSAPGSQTNENAPVGGGSSDNVDQSNSSTASSEAENRNYSTQGIDQEQGSNQQQDAEQEASRCCEPCCPPPPCSTPFTTRKGEGLQNLAA
jgi:hypothetical protein